MGNKPASRRGRSKRAKRREKRLDLWKATQTLVVITKVILWFCIELHGHR